MTLALLHGGDAEQLDDPSAVLRGGSLMQATRDRCPPDAGLHHGQTRFIDAVAREGPFRDAAGHDHVANELQRLALVLAAALGNGWLDTELGAEWHMDQRDHCQAS